MNFLDRAIAYVSPQRGMSRARARSATRIYEGASQGRRANSWQSTLGSSANTEMMIALKPLRDRARDLARNTPHATRALQIMTGHAVGNGLVPVSATGADKVDRRVMSIWNDWNAAADITGRMSFDAMQVLAVRSMIESGEVVLRMIDTPLNPSVAVPFKLQLLESDFIDHYRDGIYGAVDSGSSALKRTRLGVGLGDFDEWVGLWLWQQHPGEMLSMVNYTGSRVSQFIGRDQLLHMFRIDRPGQVRGVTWLAPVMTTARDLSDFIDAANVKARVEACFAGFITNDDSTAPLFDSEAPDALTALEMPAAGVTSMEPGMLKELRSGQDIKFAAPTSTSQIETILMYNLQAIAVGIGCTYDQLTGDLRQANYSSLRAGKLDFWRIIAQLQKNTIIPMLCQPVWARFIDRAILAGRLPARVAGYPVEWVTPAREMIDPKKDFDATKNMVRAGGMTPQQFISSYGGNSRTTLDDFKAFFDMAHEMNVTLDIDVSRVDQHGRQPPAKGTPADPNADAQDEATIAKDEGDDAADEAA